MRADSHRNRRAFPVRSLHGDENLTVIQLAGSQIFSSLIPVRLPALRRMKMYFAYFV